MNTMGYLYHTINGSEVRITAKVDPDYVLDRILPTLSLYGYEDKHIAQYRILFISSTLVHYDITLGMWGPALRFYYSSAPIKYAISEILCYEKGKGMRV